MLINRSRENGTYCCFSLFLYEIAIYNDGKCVIADKGNLDNWILKNDNAII